MNILKRLAFVILPFSISAAVYISEDELDVEAQHPFDEIPTLVNQNIPQANAVEHSSASTTPIIIPSISLTYERCVAHAINYRELLYQRYTVAREMIMSLKTDRVPYFIWMKNYFEHPVYDPFWENMIGWNAYDIRHESFLLELNNVKLPASSMTEEAVPEELYSMIAARDYVRLMHFLKESPEYAQLTIDDGELLSFIVLADPDISTQQLIGLLDVGLLPNLFTMKFFSDRHQFDHVDALMSFDKYSVHLASWSFYRDYSAVVYNNLLTVALLQQDIEQVEYWYNKGVPALIEGSQFTALEFMPFPRSPLEFQVYTEISSELITQGYTPKFAPQMALMSQWLPANLTNELSEYSAQNGMQYKPSEHFLERIETLGEELQEVPVETCLEHADLAPLFALKNGKQRFMQMSRSTQRFVQDKVNVSSWEYHFLFPQGEETDLEEQSFRRSFTYYEIDDDTLTSLREGKAIPDYLLLFAIKHAGPRVITKLDEFNINWVEMDGQGQNAVHYAVKRNSPLYILKFLLSKGIDISGDEQVLLSLINRPSISGTSLLLRSKLLRENGAAITDKHLLALYKRDDVFTPKFSEVLDFYYDELLKQDAQKPLVLALGKIK